MRYPAYLEVGPGGRTLAYVFTLPGVSVRARSPEAALAALPAAVADELARLAAAGRALPAGPGESTIEVVEAERISVAGEAASALFRYELRPTREEDVALVLDRLALAREELSRVPDGPHLAALADAEWWLHSRLGNRVPAVIPPASEPRARFEAVRAETVERLTHILPGDHERHAVFNGEPWTTRKVLRRLACLARDGAAAALAQAGAAAPPPQPTL